MATRMASRSSHSLSYNLLKRAQTSLTRSASRHFPDDRGFDTGKVTIGARLRELDVDVDGTVRFCREIVTHDHYSLFWKYMLNKRQEQVLVGALMAGIAIGVRAERMRVERVDT
jgi:hypothetical protein